MRVVRCSEAGDASVLSVEAAEDPTPGAGEVVVAVAYAGVNFADIAMRVGLAGVAFPFVPGLEGSGRVVAVGAGVDDVAVGDRVAWCPTAAATTLGAYAESVALPVGQVLPLPDDVSLLDAAALALQGLTAHYLVTERAPIGPGTTVLVHAGAGGTGRLVVQWAAHLGATVFATVSSDAKAASARAAGAHEVIRYDEGDFADEVLRLTAGAGVDYIVDGVAGGTFRGDLRALADRGTVCVFGVAGGLPEAFSPMELFPRSLTVTSGSLTNFVRTRAEVVAKADDLWAARREGWLVPVVEHRLPLAEAGAAQAALESRATIGKVVLEVAGGD
ncbi:MAG: zinc-binding dehydrogenase [Acidimicrobiales bacterium]|jgi:NADPH2:quinone reductase|nr:zinc-binding dehydrogenase [Acidimicrobiales bacterium]